MLSLASVPGGLRRRIPPVSMGDYRQIIGKSQVSHKIVLNQEAIGSLRLPLICMGPSRARGLPDNGTSYDQR